MSRDTRAMEPTITSDGRFQCEADKRVFDTREDYDKHCSTAHMKNRR
ncbi:MAG: hypothetical protein ACFCUE_06535 [Candidatus Bathyarchaeia archaeon]